jgi:hypothetical protein
MMPNSIPSGRPPRWLIGASVSLALFGCSISSETRALIDEYERTIPTCQGEADCRFKWDAARNWLVATASYPIRVENENRIETYDADSTRAGTAVEVRREHIEADRYRIIVEVDCFAISGCPPRWDTLIDFNRTVSSARP